MTPLFAAPDANGALRFVNEVERGVACGCVCPVCGSTLVARQGSADEWHFAHDVAQERPACATAANRVWHRLMVEYLQARDAAASLTLPPYRERVAIVRSLVNMHEDVQWNARVMGAWQWLEAGDERAPVARARLDTGADLVLFVEVGDAPPPPPLLAPAPEDGAAEMLFSCSTPPLSVLRDRRALWLHLAQHGELRWCHHPDTVGLLEAARHRLQARSGVVYRNWLAMSDMTTESAAPPAPLFYLPIASERAPRFACAPGHAPHASFTFYRLSDTQAWLLYRLGPPAAPERPTDGRSASDRAYALAPHPETFEGWAQALPASVGVADLAGGVVRCKSYLGAVTYLSRRTVLTRSARDPAAFAGL